MELKQAVPVFSALAHEGRLSALRLLVEAGPAGLAAGEMARRLGVPANTLSASLSVLAHAGLVSSRRDGRSIIYAAQFATVGNLITFLTDKCCEGRSELCASSASEAGACAPKPPPGPQAS